VDDDPMILTLVERSLRAEGFRVWTATRAEDARRTRGGCSRSWRFLKKPFAAAQLVSSIWAALSA
jgi:hypothetical protein